MHGTAKVRSLDALRDFRGQFAAFLIKARQALDTSEAEIQRFRDFLEKQKAHWIVVVRKLEEEVHRAKAELTQRKYAKADRRGTTEPELVLKKATAKLEHAQERLANTRKWILQLPQAIVEYEGPARQLAGVLDADLQRALVKLEQQLEALEAYARLQAPTGG